MPKHLFQSFWWGPLSPYERLCLNSFIDRAHAFDLYTYDPNLAVPAGVQLRDAAAILDQSEFFVYQNEPGRGSPAGFANLFRYKLLRDKGGWWVDTDVVCLADDIRSYRDFFASQDELINNAVLHFEAGHPLMARCFEAAKAAGKSVRWGDTGPRLLTRVLKETGNIARALPASDCYPIRYTEVVDMFRPSATEALQARIAPAQFLHLWNEMFNQNAIQKTMKPPRGSLLWQLAERHRAEGWTAEYDLATLEHIVALRAELERCYEERNLLRELTGEQQAEITRLRAPADKAL
jgi:alpha 1,4-glycosyltransferase